MGEHVFQDEADAETAAVGVGGVEEVNCVFQAPEALMLGEGGGFGAWMDDEVANAEESGCFGGLHQFFEGEVAGAGFGGSDVDAVGEWAMEGVGFEAEVVDEARSAADEGGVVVVEVLGPGTNFDPVESGVTDLFETIEDTGLPEAAGG